MKWLSIHLPGADFLLPQRRGDLCSPCGCDVRFLLAPQSACGSRVTRSQEAAVWTNGSGQIGSCDEGQVVQRLVTPSWITIRAQITPAGRHDISHHKAWKQPQGLHGCCWVGMGWGGVCVMSENDSTCGAKPSLILKLYWPQGKHILTRRKPFSTSSAGCCPVDRSKTCEGSRDAVYLPVRSLKAPEQGTLRVRKKKSKTEGKWAAKIALDSWVTLLLLPEIITLQGCLWVSWGKRGIS